MKRKIVTLSISIVVILSLAVFFMFSTFAGSSNDLNLNLGFEDSTTGGFKAKSGEKIEVSSEQFHTGKNSMKVSGRTQTWEGPEIDLTDKFIKGQTYVISAWVYQESSKDHEVRLTAYNLDNSDADQYAGKFYTTISSNKNVTSGKWTQLKGTFKFDYTGEYKKTTIYLESPDIDFNFYVDDVEVLGPAIANSTFESGTDSWYAKGSSKVESSTEVAYEGAASLKVSGRTQTWEGPEINLTDKLLKGQKYTASCWVYQNSGSAKGIRMTTYNCDDSETDQYAGKFYTSVAYNAAIESGKWTKLSGEFTFDYTGNYKSSSLYLESEDTSFNFYVDSVLLTGSVPSTQYSIEKDIPSLYEAYKDYFPIGVAIPSNAFADETKMDLVKKHFNSITAEWEMKLGPVWKSEDKIDFTICDQYVDFVAKNNMRLRGHCLVWHQDQPDWIFQDPTDPTKPASKELLISRMEKYITAVVSRYKGKIDCWDVVNESIDTSQPNNLRNTKWLQIIGPEYIELAFKYAKAADPSAKLFYNDYQTEDVAKRQAIYDLIKGLLAKNVPVSGIGLQGHISMGQPSVEDMETTIKKFSDFKLPIEVTELDITAYNSSNSTISNETLINQGYRYKQVMDMLKKYKGTITGVTIWGLKDDGSWLLTDNKVDAPLLFDKNFKAKPAFWGCADPSKLPVLIKKVEAAKTTAKVDIDAATELLWDVLPAEKILNSSGEVAGDYKLAYDSKKLYYFINVKDSTKNKKDCVNIYIDWNNSKDDFSKDDNLYLLPKSGFGTKKLVGHIVDNSTGYTIEGSIAIETAKLNTKDNTIGFDIKILDSATTTPISWNDPSQNQDKKTTNYGIVKLGYGPNYTETIKGTPIIDGQIDNAWSKASSIKTKVVSGDANASLGTVKTMWDSQYLYVLGEVKDNKISKVNTNPWEQDSLEIFVDQDFSRGTAYGEGDGQFRVNFDNEKSVTGEDVSKFITSAKLTTDGYIVECAIPLTKVTAKNGTLMGFDIQINDDNGAGKRTGQSNWNDTTGTGWQSTAVFGVVRLVEKTSKNLPLVALPIPTASPTVSVSPSPSTSPSVVPSASGAKKLVALTFDDGPDSTLTPLVLDKLEKYKTKATFFLVGEKLTDATSTVIKRAISGGNEFANHSWTYSSMDKMTTEEVKKSVDDTTAAILKYTNTKPNFFRPPNLAVSTTMYDAIDMPFASGVLAFDWDGQNTTAEQRANNVLKDVQDGSIILMHDVQPLPHPTPEALDILIPALQSKGYEFVTLTELFKSKGVDILPTDTTFWTTVKK